MENALLFFLAFVFLSLHLGIKGATCPSLDISYPSMRTRLCPRDSITYTCGLIGATNMGATVTTTWTGSAFMCPATPNSLANTIVISQVAGSSLNTVPGSCGNLSAVMTNINGTCYTSVLTIPTPQYFNGTTVMCRDSNANVIGNDTLNIQLESPPVTPTIAVRNTSSNWFTVVLEPFLSTATNYSISINGSAPISLPAASSYNGRIIDRSIILESIPSYGALPFTMNFSNLTSNAVYNISMIAINCAGSSSPRTIIGKPSEMPRSSSTPSACSTVVVITSLITYSDQLTVTWTSVPPATSYNVSINDSINSVYNISSIGAPHMYMWLFTGLTSNTVYTISVVVINCAGSSSPATITGRTGNAGPTLLPPPATTCPSPLASGLCTSAAGSSIGTAVGVSVSVTFVVSFSMGVFVASVLCYMYVSRRFKDPSHKPSSHADPVTVYDEVGSNKKMKGNAVEMDTNIAYGSHVSQNH